MRTNRDASAVFPNASPAPLPTSCKYVAFANCAHPSGDSICEYNAAAVPKKASPNQRGRRDGSAENSHRMSLEETATDGSFRAASCAACRSAWIF